MDLIYRYEGEKWVNNNFEVNYRGKKIMEKIKIIAFLMLGITLVSELAENSGKITVWQLLVINIASIILMAFLIIYMLNKIRKLKKAGNLYANFPDVRVIIPKANIDNKLVLANSDVFKKNIVPTNPLRMCVFRISMEINSSIEQLGISAVRFRDSKIIENVIKKNLVAKEAYVIDTAVLPNETINFKFDKDIDIKKMLIDELYIP
jgi:hypothetical protein